MKVNRIGLALLFLLCGSSVSAESLYKYRVQLTDKSKSVHSLEHPETFLSERALARRASQGVAVDSTLSAWSRREENTSHPANGTIPC